MKTGGKIKDNLSLNIFSYQIRVFIEIESTSKILMFGLCFYGMEESIVRL